MRQFSTITDFLDTDDVCMEFFVHNQRALPQRLLVLITLYLASVCMVVCMLACFAVSAISHDVSGFCVLLKDGKNAHWDKKVIASLITDEVWRCRIKTVCCSLIASSQKNICLVAKALSFTVVNPHITARNLDITWGIRLPLYARSQCARIHVPMLVGVKSQERWTLRR